MKEKKVMKSKKEELIEKESELIKIRLDKINILLDIIKFLKESKRTPKKYEALLQAENFYIDDANNFLNRLRESKSKNLNQFDIKRLEDVKRYLISRNQVELELTKSELVKLRSA